MTVTRTGQSTLGSINNVKSTYTSNNLSTRVNLNQERTHITDNIQLYVPEIKEMGTRHKGIFLF